MTTTIELIDVHQELNIANYYSDDVAILNKWAIEAVQRLRELEAQLVVITQLQAEVEALREDAERYQWLCNKGYNYHSAIIGSPSMSICRGPYILLEPPSHNKFSNMILTKQAADVIIDAAIAGEASFRTILRGS